MPHASLYHYKACPATCIPLPTPLSTCIDACASICNDTCIDMYTDISYPPLYIISYGKDLYKRKASSFLSFPCSIVGISKPTRQNSHSKIRQSNLSCYVWWEASSTLDALSILVLAFWKSWSWKLSLLVPDILQHHRQCSIQHKTLPCRLGFPRWARTVTYHMVAGSAIFWHGFCNRRVPSRGCWYNRATIGKSPFSQGVKAGGTPNSKIACLIPDLGDGLLQFGSCPCCKTYTN